MPLVEYSCSYCSKAVERLEGSMAAPLRFCPTCGRDAMEKLISAPNVRFTGTGFYETDYKRKESND